MNPRNMPGPTVDERIQIFSARHVYFEWGLAVVGVGLLIAGIVQALL